ERELVITRTINGPARIVFEAWSKPELLRQWWVPKSSGLSLISCEADVRVGGAYRLVFVHGTSEMAFHGKYLEVTPHSRLVWTNEESGDAGQISTVTFDEKAGKTLIVLHELYPSKEALDEAFASGSLSGMQETIEQLDEFVVKRAHRAEPGAA
ncbi:MAG TPA: SRPBCC family protein, partial [Polyangiaceae bacterium]